jgi:hypothetical protein
MRTGGCQCGRVRYWLNQSWVILYACHCGECRKQSASAFGLSIPVWQDNLSIDGRLDSYRRPTAAGAIVTGFFCPGCGTRLYHQSDRSDGTATLKAGTLDDLSDLEPVAHIWTSSALPWVSFGDVPAWRTQPDDMAAWRAGMLPPLSG